MTTNTHSGRDFDDLDLLTPKDVAFKCRVSLLRTVQRAIANGELDAIRLDRQPNVVAHRIRRSALADWQTRGLPSGVTRSRCTSRPDEDVARDNLAVA